MRKGPATWDTTDLISLFSQTYYADQRTATRTDIATPTPTTNDAPRENMSGEAIGGITVGAIVAMLIVIGAVVLWLKKRRGQPVEVTHRDMTAEMEDQDGELSRRKWYLNGRWRSEAEAKPDPRELDSRAVHIVTASPAELDSIQVG
jgi:hypothetical protein